MTSLRRFVCTSIGLLLVAAPGVAIAEPSYPEAIQAALNLKYSLGTGACLNAPSSDTTCHCMICHTTNAGGADMVSKPFGQAMELNGLSAGSDPATVKTALVTVDGLKIDSDCDKIGDIEQLEQGRDPNTGLFIDGTGRTATADPGCGQAIELFGCGARIAQVDAPWEGAAAVVAVLGLAFVRRRRPR